MTIDVVLLPRELRPEQLDGRTVVVFDVLRATTTMTAALAAGVKEIQVFADLDGALAAGGAATGPHLLAGERHAVKAAGFDLGNSPGQFNTEIYRGMTIFMSTTNGTGAIVAAKTAAALFVAALVNADAAAEAVFQTRRDVTLLCSGTEGFVSTEDTLGAGALIESLALRGPVTLASDVAWMARRLFQAERDHLPEALAQTRGGHNIHRAGLTPDIAFCANLNSLTSVGAVAGNPPTVRLWNGAG